jgi:hypothetical protein
MTVAKDIIVEFADGTGLGSTPVWTDVSQWVKHVSTKRGRQHDEDTWNAGTIQITLDDSDGRFDPENTSGPYYGMLGVNHAWRVSFPGTYIGYGYTDGFSRSWPGEMAYSETTVSCSDRFKFFNKNTFGPLTRSATAPGEGTDVRINAILTALGVGLTSSSRLVNTAGYTARNVEATTYPAKSNGLSSLLDIVKAEGGVFFVNGAGVVVYKVFAARTNDTVSNTSQTTYQFGDANVAGAFDVIAPEPLYDDELYANYVRVTDSAGGEHVWPAAYPADPIEYDLGSTLLNAVDAGFRARDLYTRRFTIRSRVEHLSLECGSSSAHATEALAREISDRVTLVTDPRGGGATVTQDYFIESISHDIDVDSGSWIFGVDVDPVPVPLAPYAPTIVNDESFMYDFGPGLTGDKNHTLSVTPTVGNYLLIMGACQYGAISGVNAGGGAAGFVMSREATNSNFEEGFIGWIEVTSATATVTVHYNPSFSSNFGVIKVYELTGLPSGMTILASSTFSSHTHITAPGTSSVGVTATGAGQLVVGVWSSHNEENTDPTWTETPTGVWTHDRDATTSGYVSTFALSGGSGVHTMTRDYASGPGMDTILVAALIG